MNEQFANLNATRALLKSVTSDLTVEQLNKIPKGFNNNIAWNLGHILVTQQLLVYALTDTKPLISENLIQTFRKGTAPEKRVSKEVLDEIMSGLATSGPRMAEDYQNGIFGNFKEYPTSYGIVLHNVEEAIVFNNMHEALHLGYIMAMKRAW
ncbi:MAG: DinB family protein [Saprospiraceae bacterium]|nr:DinB family protein [Saprospiraceae bacterium]MCB9324217.1 DinB family protein [Lewinellaceae bacterium]